MNKRRHTKRRTRYRFHNGSGVVQPIEEFERVIPVRAATFESEVSVPIYQSLFAGALTFGFLIGLAGYFQVSFDLAITGAFGLTLIYYLVSVWDARRLLRMVETIVETDLDRDGYIGDPEEQVRPDRISEWEEPTEPDYEVEQVMPHRDRPPVIFVQPEERTGQRRIRRIEGLPDTIEEALPFIAEAILEEGANFSKPELATRRQLITQKGYDLLRAKLLNQGLAYTLDNNTTHLNAAGKAFFRYYLNVVEG